MEKEFNITQAVEAAHRLRQKIADDYDRPRFHFCVPYDLGFPADPNAAFCANGRYHLFFIYENRLDSYRWGHAISTDLLHWQFLEDALIPDETDGGIYSGGVLLEKDRAIASYWALAANGGKDKIRIAVAYPPLYETWHKVEGCVIENEELGIARDRNGQEIPCADPSNLWKEDGFYYLQTGNLPLLDKYRNQPDRTDMQGDYTYLFRSADLKTWEPLHRFYDRTATGGTALSEDCMCAWFGILPKENGKDSSEYLQLFLAHNRGTQYYIGDYDRKRKLFLPRLHGRASFADNCLFAPEAMRIPDGRLIAFHWLRDNLNDDLEREKEKGWSGIHALPRSLYLQKDGTLGIKPIAELDSLRTEKQEFTFPLTEKTPLSVNARRAEIDLTVAGGSERKGKIGFLIAYGSGAVYVYADTHNDTLVVDTEKSGTMGRAIRDEAPLPLKKYEDIALRLYLDGCVLEVFACGKQAMTRQIFISEQNKPTVFCFAEGAFLGQTADVQCYTMLTTNGK